MTMKNNKSEDVAPIPENTRDLSFLLFRFGERLESLRDFVDFVNPVLTSIPMEAYEEDPRPLIPLMMLLGRIAPEGYPKLKDPDDQLAKVFGGKIDIQLPDSDSATFRFDFDGPLAPLAKSALNTFVKRTHQQSILYESSFLTLHNLAESFMTSLLHRELARHPGKAHSKDLQLTLSDLMRYESIDEARQYLIERKIEGITRGSIDEAIEQTKSILGVNASYYHDYKDFITEISKRRNLIVHNGGIVNRIYLTGVAPKVLPDVKVGDQIYVNQKYLDESISRIERFFSLLLLDVWKTEEPKDDSRAHAAIELAVGHLNAERWEIAESLSRFTSEDNNLPEGSVLRGKFNYWQSLKWQGRFDEVRDKVAQLDCSAKSDVFKLAKLALVDDEGGFFTLLRTALFTNQLSHENLKTWPIFREMRATETYMRDYHERIQESMNKPNSGDLISEEPEEPQE